MKLERILIVENQLLVAAGCKTSYCSVHYCQVTKFYRIWCPKTLNKVIGHQSFTTKASVKLV